MKWVDGSSLDTLEACIKVKKQLVFTQSNKSEYQLVYEHLIKFFKITPDDCISNFNKTIYEKSGVNIIIESSRIRILYKGEYFYCRKAYLKIITYLNELKYVFNGEIYLKRIDFKRHHLSNNPEFFLKDLKKNYWIKNSSKESYYQPELLTKKNKNSTASYFKSNSFMIACYNKTEQIEMFKKKLNVLKRPKSLNFYKKQIQQYKNKFKKDDVIIRCEFRLLNKDICSFATGLIFMKLSEKTFLKMLGDCFLNQHPMINDKKKISKRYKSFFEWG